MQEKEATAEENSEGLANVSPTVSVDNTSEQAHCQGKEQADCQGKEQVDCQGKEQLESDHKNGLSPEGNT